MSARRGLDRVGVALACLLAGVLLLGPLAAPDPFTSDLAAPVGASRAHWLGLDPLHRDLLARLAAGGRVSLFVGVVGAATALALGAAVGMASGLLAASRLAWLDTALVRAIDVLLALPYLVLVGAAGVALGRPTLASVLVTLGATGWLGVARIVRERTIEIARAPYVEAARGLGLGSVAVAARHVLPNVAPVLLALGAGLVGSMILAEAALGFLGVSVPPPTPSWGRMIRDGESYFAARPALVLAPGAALFAAVLAAHRISRALEARLDRAARSVAPGAADLLVAGAALLALLALPGGSAAAPRGAAAAGPARGGTLRLATYVTATTLDPALAYDELAAEIQRLLFAPLLRVRPDGSIEPVLAARVEVAPDRVRVELRRDAWFHDGSPVRARDVKRTLERTLAPASGAPTAQSFAAIEGFAAFREGAKELAGVRVLDEHTVEIRLSAPDATFAAVLSLPAASPVCPSTSAVASRTDPSPPCGAGPFRLDVFDPDRLVRLRRHDAWFDAPRPWLDAIEWSTHVRPTAQEARFARGELDVLREWSASALAAYGADPRWARSRRLSTKFTTNAIFLNTELPPFDDARVRRAVRLAVDPSALAVVRPDLVPLDSVLPPGFPGHRATTSRRPDVAAALAEMAAAGHAFDPATGRGGLPEPVDYWVPASFEQYAAEIYAQQLARVGIRIRIRVVSPAAYHAEVGRRRTAQMGWAGWGADFPHPATFFEGPLTKDGIADEGSTNLSFFSDPALEALLARARAAPSFDAYAEAEALVAEASPWIPTYAAGAFLVWHPYVGGLDASEPFPAGVWLSQEGR